MQSTELRRVVLPVIQSRLRVMRLLRKRWMLWVRREIQINQCRYLGAVPRGRLLSSRNECNEAPFYLPRLQRNLSIEETYDIT